MRAIVGVLSATVSAAALLAASAGAQTGDMPAVDADDIGGVLMGPGGPEAGVWVVAETADLADPLRQDRGHRRPRPLRGARPARAPLQRLGPGLRPGRLRQGRRASGRHDPAHRPRRPRRPRPPRSIRPPTGTRCSTIPAKSEFTGATRTRRSATARQPGAVADPDQEPGLRRLPPDGQPGHPHHPGRVPRP